MAELLISSDKYSKDVNILLIGKSGNGITSVANTIFWKKKYCKTTSQLSSNKINAHQGSIGTQKHMDRTLNVIDIPGIAETKSKRARISLIEQFKQSIDICPNGYHSVLLILKFGSRLSEEDKTIFRFIKAIFGESIYTKYCILIMTYGDNFHIQKESMNIKTFEEWSKKQTGIFQTILQDCCNRIILFDNYSKEENSRTLVTDHLMNAIDLLNVNPYNLNDFQSASRSRLSIVVELKIPRLREKILRSKQRLLDDYIKAKHLDHDRAMLNLELIVNLAKDLEEKINRKLKDTNLQLEETKDIEEFINKLKQDLLKGQEKKEKDVETATLIEKTKKDNTESKLRQLEKQLELATETAAKAKESERSIIEENKKIEKKQLKSNETEAELRLQLKQKCEEIQTHIQEIRNLKKRAEEDASKNSVKQIEEQAIRNKLAKYESKLKNIKREKMEMSTLIKDHEDSIERLKKEISVAKKEVANMKMEIEKYETVKLNKSENSDGLENLRKQLEDRRIALNKIDEMEALKQKMKELNGIREKQAAEIENLKRNVDDGISQMLKNTQTIEQLNGKINELEAKNEKLKQSSPKKSGFWN